MQMPVYTDDETCCCLLNAGGKVTRDAGPVKGGKSVIAFVEDPTGYKWELITREEPIPEPIAQVGTPYCLTWSSTQLSIAINAVDVVYTLQGSVQSTSLLLA